MDKIQKFDQYLHDGYYGRILDGDYSDRLKKHIAQCIERFRAYDELGSPTIPYIAAWQEKKNIIWYEYVSRQFIELLGCEYTEAPQCFRRSIIARHRYVKKDSDAKPHEEILKGSQVDGRKYELRAEAQNMGTTEAVYKISAGGGQTHWLKDQAVLEHFKSDNIIISLGNLCIVTKEMEAEEHLKQTQEALRESEQNYRTQAIHDNLTDLYNTRYLYSALSDLIEKSKLSQQSFSLVFMDIDNFKTVVDTHGHLNASQALQEIAATIKETLKSPAYGVAYGGDEFVLVLPGFKKQQAMETAETVRTRIKETLYLQDAGLKVQISASLGVSTFPDDAGTLTELLALADQAMFSVKERGKDLVCGIFYETTGGEKTKRIISYDCKD
ncbi:MAG: GGDEF domain-containing protein [Desulfobacterales bacterium]|jgi:diguanylate cyclase (GGDEF)-like protein